MEWSGMEMGWNGMEMDGNGMEWNSVSFLAYTVHVPVP